jgi:hypothetical protein
VFRAALINSCDKYADDGTRTIPQGYLLGMERTVKDRAGLEWFDSGAFANDAIPLDNEFGAGHLNASRALRQYQYGETQLGMPLRHIGWANTTISPGGSQYYYFQNDLVLGSFISLTLCWDRVVGLTNNAGAAHACDLTDTFSNTGLANLNLFPEFLYSDGTWGQERQSISAVDSTEHIYKRISMTGKYRVKVDFQGGLNQNTNYALAWWAIPTPGAAGVLAIGAIGAALRRRRLQPARDTCHRPARATTAFKRSLFFFATRRPSHPDHVRAIDGPVLLLLCLEFREVLLERALLA